MSIQSKANKLIPTGLPFEADKYRLVQLNQARALFGLPEDVSDDGTGIRVEEVGDATINALMDEYGVWLDFCGNEALAAGLSESEPLVRRDARSDPVKRVMQSLYHENVLKHCGSPTLAFNSALPRCT
jgi:hypothetical protein